VVVFRSASEIEARVVLGLLESQGFNAFRSSGNPPSILPMAVNALGEYRIAVPEDEADDAKRVIESHREDVGSRVIRIADEFEGLQARIDYPFNDRGLPHHPLP